jgi:hypothetical protein
MFGGGGDDPETITSGGSTPYIDPNLQKVNKARADWITKYLPGFVPGEAYGNKFTAPMTGQEKTAMGWLDKYLANQDTTTGVIGDATRLVQGTLTDKFDPNKSDYYKAFRAEADYNKRKAIDETRRDTASRNQFFSSEALNKEGDINAQTSNFLNKTMATLVETERERQMQAVPMAQQLALDPANRAQTGLQLGQIPRLIENLDLEKQYTDFLRKRNEQAMPLTVPMSGSAMMQQNPYTQQVSSGSGGGNIMGQALGSLAQSGAEWGLNTFMPGVGTGMSALGNWLFK